MAGVLFGMAHLGPVPAHTIAECPACHVHNAGDVVRHTQTERFDCESSVFCTGTAVIAGAQVERLGDARPLNQGPSGPRLLDDRDAQVNVPPPRV